MSRGSNPGRLFVGRRRKLKPIRNVEEFQRILDRALKEHEKRGLDRVDLGILEESAREEKETLRRIGPRANE